MTQLDMYNDSPSSQEISYFTFTYSSIVNIVADLRFYLLQLSHIYSLVVSSYYVRIQIFLSCG